jgi:hypothetical protein
MSPTLLTRKIRTIRGEPFDRMIADISGRIHYVNLLMNSGTILGFNAFHAVLANSNHLDIILALDTDENRNYNTDNYEAAYYELIQQIRQYDIELVSIICDNCPSQINGVAQALIHHQTWQFFIFRV